MFLLFWPARTRWENRKDREEEGRAGGGGEGSRVPPPRLRIAGGSRSGDANSRPKTFAMYNSSPAAAASSSSSSAYTRYYACSRDNDTMFAVTQGMSSRALAVIIACGERAGEALSPSLSLSSSIRDTEYPRKIRASARFSTRERSRREKTRERRNSAAPSEKVRAGTSEHLVRESGKPVASLFYASRGLRAS